MQHKVYFDIAFFLGKRGQEGLRQLKKNSFALKLNQNNQEYLELTYNESTKKSQGDDNNEQTEQPILLSREGNRRCPVTSFKLYLSKLTNIDDLFQTPNTHYKYPGDKWYKESPVGEGTIGKFMKEISKNAGLSYIYTNHCIRGTTATAMHRSGYSLHEIAQVTRHKNIESLKYYLEEPTLDDMQNYSKSLFDYAEKPTIEKNESQNDLNQSDSEAFEAPPVPTRNIYDEVQKEKENKKVTTPNKVAPQVVENKEIIPIFPTFDENSNNSNNSDTPVHAPLPVTTSTHNFMQMYRQNPIGMFVGANLNNCTININIPK